MITNKSDVTVVIACIHQQSGDYCRKILVGVFTNLEDEEAAVASIKENFSSQDRKPPMFLYYDVPLNRIADVMTRELLY